MVELATLGNVPRGGGNEAAACPSLAHAIITTSEKSSDTAMNPAAPILAPAPAPLHVVLAAEATLHLPLPHIAVP